MGHPWCAGSNLSKTFLTQPAHHRCYGSKELGARQGTDGEHSEELWLSRRSMGSPGTLFPAKREGDERAALLGFVLKLSLT